MPSTKKRKVEDDGDSVLNQNSYANANELVSALIDQMNSLTIEADNLNQDLPDQFDDLLLKIEELPRHLKKLADRMKVAKMRSQLDPDQIQTTTQFGVNPLYLTEKFTVGCGKKRTDWCRMVLPSTYETLTLNVGDVTHNGVLYRNLIVKYKKYAYFSGIKKHPHLFECSFSPVCDHRSNGNSNITNHILAHFDAPIFFCLCCRYTVLQKCNFINHLNLCMSDLTGQAEIDKVLETCKKKSLKHSDFRKIAQQLWNDGKIDLTLICGWSSEKFNLFVDYFEFIFRLPSLNSQHETILSLNNEFSDLINSLCAPSRHGNDAELYGVFETTGQDLTIQIAPTHGKYAGSQCETRTKGNNKYRHRLFVEDVNRTSSAFHTNLHNAKREGRIFSFVKILVGIRSDFKSASGEWDKARYIFEDSLKVMFDALSEDPWNSYLVSRNETSESYSWPVEKRLLFGFHVFRRQWNVIEAGLADEKNVL